MLGKLDDTELRALGWTTPSIRGRDHVEVNLLGKSEGEILAVRAALERIAGNTRNVKELIEDIDRWLVIVHVGNEGDTRPRTLRQFSDLATQYLRKAPGRRVYVQSRDTKEWLPYYVNFVEFEKERRSGRDRSYYIPAAVNIHLLYWELGSQCRSVVTLHGADVDGMTTSRALAANGIVIETPELRERYLAQKRAFDAVWDTIGVQYTTEGHGRSLSSSHWGGSRRSLMSDGIPAKVVLDVVSLPDERNTRTRELGHVKPYFWAGKNPKAGFHLTSDSLGQNMRLLKDRVPETEVEEPEIPIRPTVVVYHLDWHQRFEVNAADLRPYQFDTRMSDQIVLPDTTERLVRVLVSQGRVSFSDIIEGKGSGICVILGGPPGVGKTLTAQVFAEATERPLLSIHAAQLGINPNDIESNLAAILAKGSRWNAVVLLDEADVYVNERGHDLGQNAIVAAFLRVLERHTATIFMTTNRMGTVDDAVLSRCIARVDYGMPGRRDQERIWKVLNDLNGTGLTDRAITQIAANHENLSGRDIKQLLKLAALWSANRGEEVNPDAIDFVRQFLPTRPIEPAE